MRIVRYVTLAALLLLGVMVSQTGAKPAPTPTPKTNAAVSPDNANRTRVWLAQLKKSWDQRYRNDPARERKWQNWVERWQRTRDRIIERRRERQQRWNDRWNTSPTTPPAPDPDPEPRPAPEPDPDPGEGELPWPDPGDPGTLPPE
jgi:hypothetical protein